MPKAKPIRKLPSVKYLRECFTYNRHKGELRWKVRPRKHFATEHGWIACTKRDAGKLAASIDAYGYPTVRIGYHLYKVHRVIWKLETGMEPPTTIDHTDGNPSNNRWRNLRAATKAEQMRNLGIPQNNTSGRRGVIAHRNKWVARISHNRIIRYLGIFGTVEEASAAYENAARSFRGKFYRRIKQ